MPNSMSISKTSSLLINIGDPAASQFTEGDLTHDAVLHELDLSAIVPQGATFVQFTVTAMHNASGYTFFMIPGNNVNPLNALGLVAPGNGIICFTAGLLACSPDRKIKYFSSEVPAFGISITIRGWILE